MLVYQARGKGSGNRQLRQAAACLRHFSERAEPEVIAQTGSLQLAPPDSRKVPGNQRQHRAAFAQPFKQGFNARTGFVAQVRHALFIQILRHVDNPRHGRCNPGFIEPGGSHHPRKDIRIQHAVDRDTLRGAFNAGHLANGIDQGLTVVRSGPANERAVNVE